MGSYAGALGSNNVQPNHKSTHPPQPPRTSSPGSTRQFSTSNTLDSNHQYSPTPQYQAKTKYPEFGTYILTFQTDKSHHKTLTDLRTKYFPKKLNHLDAHLTLFHALPGSKLEESILPFLEKTSSQTPKFHIIATTPFKIRKGIAIGLPKSAGGDQSRAFHAKLQKEWNEFLSDQDAGGFAPHYTVMNKVDDQKAVEDAFSDLKKEFKAVHGTVEGVTLWKYEGPGWEHMHDFEFKGKE